MPSDERIQEAIKSLATDVLLRTQDTILKLIDDGMLYPAGAVADMQDRIKQLEAEVKRLKNSKP